MVLVTWVNTNWSQGSADCECCSLLYRIFVSAVYGRPQTRRTPHLLLYLVFQILPPMFCWTKLALNRVGNARGALTHRSHSGRRPHVVHPSTDPLPLVFMFCCTWADSCWIKFWQCPIVERLTVSLMRKGRNSGKKLMAARIVKHTLEIIHLLTDQNPVQVLFISRRHVCVGCCPCVFFFSVLSTSMM